ncbi:MAG: hypothetical protein QOJ54_2091 [Aliidongia sp.]|nr:hypothetical protein [Aliidongia sp.]
MDVLGAAVLDAAAATAVIDRVSNPAEIDILNRLVIFISFAKIWPQQIAYDGVSKWFPMDRRY